MAQEQGFASDNLCVLMRVVYSAIFGGRDRINDSHFRTDGWDYVLFTDDASLRSDFWDIRVVRPNSRDPRRAHKTYKLRPDLHLHDYDCSIWADGNLVLKDLSDFNDCRDAIRMQDHPDRKCVYDEAIACIAMGKDNKAVIERHVDSLRKVGFPERRGLTYGGFMFRNHIKSAPMMTVCHALVEMGSARDQLSFVPSSWMTQTPIGKIPGVLSLSKYFTYHQHRAQ